MQPERRLTCRANQSGAIILMVADMGIDAYSPARCVANAIARIIVSAGIPSFVHSASFSRQKLDPGPLGAQGERLVVRHCGGAVNCPHGQAGCVKKIAGWWSLARQVGRGCVCSSVVASGLAVVDVAVRWPGTVCFWDCGAAWSASFLPGDGWLA